MYRSMFAWILSWISALILALGPGTRVQASPEERGRPAQKLDFGDSIQSSVRLQIDLGENETPLQVDVQLSATVVRDDLPFGGMIDGLKPILQNVESFDPNDFPHLVRTHVIHQLLKHRADYLKPLAETFGASNRDFRPLPNLLVRYSPERFPYFDEYYQKLNLQLPADEIEKEKNGLRRLNQNRFAWILLHHSAKIYRAQVKLQKLNEEAEMSRFLSPEYDKGISPPEQSSPAIQSAIFELAKFSEFAPRLLEVGLPQSRSIVGTKWIRDVHGKQTLHRRFVREIFADLDPHRKELLLNRLESYDVGQDPQSINEIASTFAQELQTARELTHEHLLVALNSNREAIHFLTETNLEEKLDDLIFATPIIERILSSDPISEGHLTYKEFIPHFEKAYHAWVQRVQDRLLKKQMIHTLSVVAMGLLTIGAWVPARWVVPYISVAALRWATFGGVVGLSVSAWNYYWDTRRAFLRQRYLFEGAWFVMPLARYRALQEEVGNARLAAYTEAIFSLTFVFGGYGRLMAIQKSGPLGMARLIYETRQEMQTLRAGSRLSRFQKLRFHFAESRLLRLEQKLLREVERLQMKTKLGDEELAQKAFGERILRTNERPLVQFMDNRFWPKKTGYGIQSIAERAEEMQKAVPKIPNPFRRSEWQEAFTEIGTLWRELGERVAKEGGSRGRTYTNVLKEILQDRGRQEFAIDLVSVNVALAFMTETFLREGAVFDGENRLFGEYSLPKKGAMFTMGITGSTLLTMAFSTGINNPIIRPFFPMLVAGGNAFLFQKLLLDRDLGEIDPFRIGYDMGFNVLGSWYSVAPQKKLVTFIGTRSMTLNPRLSYLAGKSVFLAGGTTIMIIYCAAAMFLFETSDMSKDQYGNYYRETSDLDLWHQNLEGY